MSKAYIALGTNLGNRKSNLQNAVTLINSRTGIFVRQLSGIYETAPVGGPEQGPYLNACALLESKLPPTILMQTLLDLEDQMGRIRTEHWGPRIIDLDLLVYEGVIINTPLLTLPHPRMEERDFVLIPLNDLAPNLLVPGWTKTVGQVLENRLPAGEAVQLCDSFQ